VKGKPLVALALVSDDIQSAHDYFEVRVAGAGDRFLQRYFAVTGQIAMTPWLFPVKFVNAVVDARRNPRWIRRTVRGRRGR
jgi:hypothetical protein